MQLNVLWPDMGMIPWRSTVGEGRVAAVDVLQPGGQVPLKDIFEDGTPWCSFWDDVNGGRLKTDKVNEARKVELDWLQGMPPGIVPLPRRRGRALPPIFGNKLDPLHS